MTTYHILSPSGKTHTLTADSFYAAIQMAVRKDEWKYAARMYFNLNPQKKTGGWL